jgi:hypothetical protein
MKVTLFGSQVGDFNAVCNMVNNFSIVFQWRVNKMICNEDIRVMYITYT